MSFVLNCRLYFKNRKVDFVSKTPQFQIQDTFEDGKPDIVLKNSQGIRTKMENLTFLKKQSRV